jgi:YidC/Oxa1 family membrane protein insertase
VVKFESPDVGGVKLVKTYTFKRGAYDMACARSGQHRHGAGVAAAVPAAGARRQQAAGESSFYSTFTGPAVYTEAKKFHKIDFKDIDNNKADVDKQSAQRLRGHGAALLRQRLDPGRRHQARAVRRARSTTTSTPSA